MYSSTRYMSSSSLTRSSKLTWKSSRTYNQIHLLCHLSPTCVFVSLSLVGLTLSGLFERLVDVIGWRQGRFVLLLIPNWILVFEVSLNDRMNLARKILVIWLRNFSVYCRCCFGVFGEGEKVIEKTFLIFNLFEYLWISEDVLLWLDDGLDLE